MELDPSTVDPKHLKISYRSPGEGLSRRDLIFGLVKPHYEIVPAVEHDRCAAWRGCSVCVASCPHEAISLTGQRASIDKDHCTGCGACLPSCPNDAITSPLLNPAVLDTSLQSLLARSEGDLEPKMLLITSEDSTGAVAQIRESLPPQCVELKLPCIGALSPWLLLRALDLGALVVGVVPCGPSCRRRCRPERWRQAVGFSRALLAQLGLEPEGIRVFPPGVEPTSAGAILKACVGQVATVAADKFGKTTEKSERTTLVAVLAELARRLGLGGASLSTPDAPFGLLTIAGGDTACTLCGSCADRCPTTALTLREQQGASQLLFDHSRCVACEACVKVCPERVLQMERVLDFSRLGASAVLAEDRVLSCQRCGAEIAPLSMLRRVRQQLQTRNGSALAVALELCPACRVFADLSAVQNRPEH